MLSASNRRLAKKRQPSAFGHLSARKIHLTRAMHACREIFRLRCHFYHDQIVKDLPATILYGSRRPPVRRESSSSDQKATGGTRLPSNCTLPVPLRHQRNLKYSDQAVCCQRGPGDFFSGSQIGHREYQRHQPELPATQTSNLPSDPPRQQGKLYHYRTE
jgi:hypothetical protein